MSLLRRPWRFVSFGKWNGARPKAMSKCGSVQQRRDRVSSRFCSIAPTHEHGCHGDDYADCRCAGGWLCLRARLSTDERRQREVFWYIRMRSKPIAAPACAAWAWQWRSLVISHHRLCGPDHTATYPPCFSSFAVVSYSQHVPSSVGTSGFGAAAPSQYHSAFRNGVHWCCENHRLSLLSMVFI